MRNAEREVFLFRRRLVIAGRARARRVRRAVRPLRLPAGVPARSLPHACGIEPRRDRADRAQSRRHHGPQRRRARAELLRVHARAHAREDPATSTRRSTSSSTIVDIQPRDRKRFRKLLDESKNFESMPLRTRLSDEEVARFAVNRYRFPGVEIKARLFRQYPYGEVASHVIGYIGRITDKDLERIASWDETANYKGSDYIGKVGVELSYERELHGTTGVEEVEVDAGGRAVRTLSRSPPTSGNNLRLSLDIKLQEAAEQAFGDRRGALVAIEPVDRRHPRVRVASRATTPTSSSKASTPRTGKCSTSRPTSRCSIDRCAARIRRARRSSRSSRLARSPTASARRSTRSAIPASSSCPARRIASATTSRAATARSTCTSRSWCRATRTTTCSRARPTSTTPRASSRSSASGTRPAWTSRAS